MNMKIAIDGPAGSGKSTIARTLAARLGFTYLDTGAMYRSIAWAALRDGIALDDERALEALALERQVSFGRGDDGGQTVAIGGEDVTLAIRTPQVDAAVSRVAKVPEVRRVCVARQRELAHEGDVVAEGRDIGSVVFPDAEVKVFLTATPEARARRRVAQNVERGLTAPEALDEAAILASIVERDRIDSQRAESPLVQAPDAVRIDTSDLGIDEVLAHIERLVAEARA